MSGRIRIALVAVMTGVVISFAAPSRAQNGIQSFWQSSAQSYQRRNCWPEPFSPWDRYSLREAMAANVEQGWELQNMVADFHFSKEKDGKVQLNEAGRRKIEQILTETPAQRRMIYVHKVIDPRENETRLELVRQVAAKFLPPGAEIPMRETTAQLPSWPADRMDILARMANKAMRAPVLPGSQGGGGGGGSGGGNAPPGP